MNTLSIRFSGLDANYKSEPLSSEYGTLPSSIPNSSIEDLEP